MSFASRFWLGTLATLLLVGIYACFAARDSEGMPVQPPDAATRQTIDKKMAELADAISELRTKAKTDTKLAGVIPDVEIYHQAAVWITRLNEFTKKEYPAWTIEVLERGLERAKKAKSGDFAWLTVTGRTMVRGYRSKIDDSVQPYAVTLPAEYGKDLKRAWRLDVVLHGRDNDLNEVKFLHNHGDKVAPKDLQYIKIDVYGRGNNAYRWAGEVDVFEAKAAFEDGEKDRGRGDLIDKRRQVLRGFSMGGAGAWHIGLHYPDKWCVIGPGAGFTETHRYIKNLPADLGWPQEQMLRIYDAVDYAENAFNVPIVAYGGEKDAQLQASKNIEAALKPTKLPVNFQILIAPGLAHQFPAEWQKKAEEAYAPFVKVGRPEYPKRVRFVTYTLKYNSCDWVTIDDLEKHYEKAVVDAEKTADGFNVSTTNVGLIRLGFPKSEQKERLEVVIDKQTIKVTVTGWESKIKVKGTYLPVMLWKEDGKWVQMSPTGYFDLLRRRKAHPLQGPIDDAFASPFLCVRGTGKPMSPRVHEYTDASLKRFQQEWAKYMRGELPVKNDVDVTKEDMDQKNLILFGDPGSNKWIFTLRLAPLYWNKDQVAIAGKTYDAQTHVPIAIGPNPLYAGDKYIVLNSGHTFHEDDFKGTNALLYPRFGDYAVLKLADKGGPLAVERVELNGLFDEQWKVYAGK